MLGLKANAPPIGDMLKCWNAEMLGLTARRLEGERMRRHKTEKMRRLEKANAGILRYWD